MWTRFPPVSPDEEATLPKILVIDDDPEVRDLISCILEMEGHSVVAGRGWHQGRGDAPRGRPRTSS